MSSDADGRAWLIYTTVATPEEAEDIAGRLVSAGLAGCANIFPGMRSVYAWQGRVQREGETAMLIKTVALRREAAMQALRDMHPYETPAVLAWEVDATDADYLDWLRAAAAPAG